MKESILLIIAGYTVCALVIGIIYASIYLIP